MSHNYDVTIDEIVQAGVNAGTSRIFTSMPGKIISYSAAAQTCTVQPMIKMPIFDPQTDEQGTSETLPQLVNIPVAFESGGGFSIVFPLVAGDTVTIEWQMLATGQWRSSGDVSEPIDVRKHSIGSALVRPDARTIAKALLGPSMFSGYLAIGADGDPTGTIRMKSGQVICGGAAPVPLATAQPTVTAVNLLQTQVAALQAAFVSLCATGAIFKATALVDASGATLLGIGSTSASVVTPDALAVTQAVALIPTTITQGQ